VPIPGCCHPSDGPIAKRHWGGYEPDECDDANPCTTDTCDADTYSCKHTPVGPSDEEGLGACCASDAACPKENCLPGICSGLGEGEGEHGFCVTDRTPAQREGGCCLNSTECCPFEAYDAQSGISLEIGICDYACQCVFIPRNECECSSDEECEAKQDAQDWIAQRLQQPSGVGPLTALTFVLLVEDPTRFAKSRDVGAYFGLVPRLDASSTSQPQLRITKAGDAFGRRLLVSAAHYILGTVGPDCNLKRHGEAIAARGGGNAKKRAVVAVARKLAVLLHRLWVSEQAYEPDYPQPRRAA
jgi:hypothetical protein